MSHASSRKGYFVVFAALMVLLVVTVAAATVHWPSSSVGVMVALIIATVKAVLVVMYFMHVRGASRLTRVFVLAGVFWLGILFVFTLNDYLSRSWLPSSRGWTEAQARDESTSKDNQSSTKEHE